VGVWGGGRELVWPLYIAADIVWRGYYKLLMMLLGMAIILCC